MLDTYATQSAVESVVPCELPATQARDAQRQDVDVGREEKLSVYCSACHTARCPVDQLFVPFALVRLKMRRIKCGQVPLRMCLVAGLVHVSIAYMSWWYVDSRSAGVLLLQFTMDRTEDSLAAKLV